MKHIVTTEEYQCPKCEKKQKYSGVQVFDFLVCPECFYEKYEKELFPTFQRQIRKYFNKEKGESRE